MGEANAFHVRVLEVSWSAGRSAWPKQVCIPVWTMSRAPMTVSANRSGLPVGFQRVGFTRRELNSGAVIDPARVFCASLNKRREDRSIVCKIYRI